MKVDLIVDLGRDLLRLIGGESKEPPDPGADAEGTFGHGMFGGAIRWFVR